MWRGSRVRSAVFGDQPSLATTHVATSAPGRMPPPPRPSGDGTGPPPQSWRKTPQHRYVVNMTPWSVCLGYRLDGVLHCSSRVCPRWLDGDDMRCVLAPGPEHFPPISPPKFPH